MPNGIERWRSLCRCLKSGRQAHGSTGAQIKIRGCIEVPHHAASGDVTAVDRDSRTLEVVVSGRERLVRRYGDVPAVRRSRNWRGAGAGITRSGRRLRYGRQRIACDWATRRGPWPWGGFVAGVSRDGRMKLGGERRSRAREPPLQQVKPAFARLGVLSDGPQLLARGCVVAGRQVAPAAPAALEAAHDAKAQKARDRSPARRVHTWSPTLLPDQPRAS
jgi:hypothetical protein